LKLGLSDCNSTCVDVVDWSHRTTLYFHHKIYISAKSHHSGCSYT